jgi:hypothetical protein
MRNILGRRPLRAVLSHPPLVRAYPFVKRGGQGPKRAEQSPCQVYKVKGQDHTTPQAETPSLKEAAGSRRSGKTKHPKARD